MKNKKFIKPEFAGFYITLHCKRYTLKDNLPKCKLYSCMYLFIHFRGFVTICVNFSFKQEYKMMWCLWVVLQTFHTQHYERLFDYLLGCLVFVSGRKRVVLLTFWSTALLTSFLNDSLVFNRAVRTWVAEHRKQRAPPRDTSAELLEEIKSCSVNMQLHYSVLTLNCMLVCVLKKTRAWPVIACNEHINSGAGPDILRFLCFHCLLVYKVCYFYSTTSIW